MSLDFDILGPDDKPALLGLTNPDLQSACASVLQELDYKVHITANHQDFAAQFTQIQYHVVILEELFAAYNPPENTSFLMLQEMPMHLRRHAVVLLFGRPFRTLDPLQAFQQSVHAVINHDDLSSLGQIILKAISDNNLFLNTYRDAQTRIAQGMR